MKTVLHRKESRGHADHGWLKTYHSFSFAEYYNPDKMHFGALRVLNDDTVAGGKGFGWHPHDNMEIVSIPLEGELEHGDGMQHGGVIRKGDIQVMSAGTGIVHQEINADRKNPVKFLQIWVFPDEQNVTPRYDQKNIANGNQKNDFQLVVSPQNGGADLWIHQDAWFSLGEFDDNFSKTYHLKNKNHGVYLFVIDGQLRVANQILQDRDAIGVWDASTLDIEALTHAHFLLIEVPMKLAAFIR